MGFVDVSLLPSLDEFRIGEEVDVTIKVAPSGRALEGNLAKAIRAEEALRLLEVIRKAIDNYYNSE